MGNIVKVSGPLVVAEGMQDVSMFDVVHVSDKRLIGEVIEIHEDKASIQVYENTEGLGPGEPVETTGAPLEVELGPGLIGSIYDGIQRPLNIIRDRVGNNIMRGVNIEHLDKEKRWHFIPRVQVGDRVLGGDIIGAVQETPIVEHRILVPPHLTGVIEEISEGDYTLLDTAARLKKEDGEIVNIKLMQKWPVRQGRPYKEKLAPDRLLVTGQRVIDTFFPITEGGTACVPGPFGSGKTVIQHQLAKWVQADVIVYIGCGERGNEMTDVLMEFPELEDPRTGESLMKRTVLIANTSDMPVAAREASIYTGITIAEYFREMGYDVALMADSTSRWAEALREMSGRLEEMPGEEGYPAYLSSRLAQFYERAGRIICPGQDNREGTLTAIGAVSPPGGDLSEPVTQSTLRIVKVFWGLDSSLAYRRHFPAINWLVSYSLYKDEVNRNLPAEMREDWPDLRAQGMKLLHDEAEVEEIVRLIGIDAVSDHERIILESAKMLREDYLQQNAFNEVDTYTSLHKQYKMLKVILKFYNLAQDAVKQGISIVGILDIGAIDRIGRMKYIKEDDLDSIDVIEAQLEADMQRLREGNM